MKRYNPQEIEPNWQQVWAETEIYKTDMSRTSDKFYVIPFLPYPSGDLHVGHWYNYVGADVVARMHRMLGQNVFTTLGFDAFGLPAENAAIKRNIQPAVWTKQNIANMIEQIKSIGASYDWSHSLMTCDPAYYRWNQWLFLRLYEKGLAYRKKALVNWCPKDQTVLANEQVVGDNNVCERCGTPVVQKELEQWFYKITDYADRLLADMDSVDWPTKVKTMQTNWIGKSAGALVKFKLDGHDKHLEVFTTRPDTIFGATYMVMAPEHPLVKTITSEQQKNDVEKYITEAERKTELERQEGEKKKTGVFSGAYAVNPATGKKIPVWIADYVLMGYGTGAIMAVPAHDERDHDFATKFELPIRKVIEPVFTQTTDKHQVRGDLPFVERQAITAIVKHWSEDKYLGLKWKTVDWETFITGGVEKGQTPEEAALAELMEETGYLHAKLVRKLDKVHAKFFHVPKGENRLAHFSSFYFELLDGDKAEVDKSEQANHEVVWLSADEMENFRLPESHRYLWNQLQGNDKPFTGEGLMTDSEGYNGLDSSTAREKITDDLIEKKLAKAKTNYRLRDWLISRQRYWGTPIPVIYCEKCGIQPVPDKDLPVVLPEDVEFELTGQSPLVNRPDFVNTKCPNCGGLPNEKPIPWIPLWILAGTFCVTLMMKIARRFLIQRKLMHGLRLITI
jgi:leucyl-tRNA synthetase